MERSGNGSLPVDGLTSGSPPLLSRRHFVSGVLGAAVVPLLRPHPGHIVSARAQADNTPLVEPRVITSRNSVLEAMLVAQPQRYDGPGSVNYNGIVPGPTLRLRTGETLKIKLINHLSEDHADPMAVTNLHVHGLHVSPLGRGDNVFLHLMPGETWDFEYQIPVDHPSGLFWYHPHPHHHTNPQVAGGMAGAIIIEGDLDELPQTINVLERLLVLQGPFFPGNTSGFVINGSADPTIQIQRGEWQRWRILNATAGTFFNLQLEGHQFHRVSVDGNYLTEVAETDRLLLGPAERAEVLIQGGESREEPYLFRSLPWAGLQGEFPLARVFVDGFVPEPIETTPLPTRLVSNDDLRATQIAERREITFRRGFKISHTADDPVGHIYDPNRVDQTVELGATEEWVLRNDTVAWHPFHIHVNDFQVVSSNGEEQLEPFIYYKDTLPLPPKTDGVPGEVVIRIPFLDYTGKFVFHCHILDHEDGGMMGVVEVVQPVLIDEATYEPGTAEVLAGTTVRWRNHSAQPQSVVADGGAFTSPPLAPGETFSVTFDTPGVVAYHSASDPEMRATIVVV
jgi:suppressor of ftsI